MNSVPTQPLFPFLVRIDGTIPYKTFFKKNYKYVNTMEVKFFHSILGNRTRTKMLTRKLNHIGKKLKFAQGVKFQRALIYCPKHLDPSLKSVVKKFYQVKSLSLLIGGAKSDTILLNYLKWLKLTKYLKKFSLTYRRLYTGEALSPKAVRQLNMFMKAIKRKRHLETFKMMVKADYSDDLKSFIRFQDFPSSLKVLTFCWQNSLTRVSASPPTAQETSLAHMKKLKILNLNLPMPIKIMQSIIDSITNPRDLKKISFWPYYEPFQKHYASQYLANYVEPFNNLQKLELNLSKWSIIPASFIKLVQNLLINEFKLDIVLKRTVTLVILGQLLKNLEAIQSLTIRIRCSLIIGSEVQECFTSFLSQLSQMKCLNKLKLYFMGDSNKVPRPIKFLPHLTKCIENCPNIRSLSFRTYQKGTSKDWTELIKALKPRASRLKLLRLDFAHLKLQEETFKELVSMLQNMNNIKTMGLHALWSNSKEWFDTLADNLATLPNVKNLKMHNVGGVVYKSALARFLKELLVKRKFVTFSCTKSEANQEAWDQEISHSEKIDLKKVVRKNPALCIANIPFNVFTAYSDINFCKWAQ